jgi:hypothetical protein
LDWIGAELSNIPDDQTVPILTSVLTNNFLLLLLYFGCTTDRRSIPLGYFLHLLVKCHQESSSVFCVVFVTEKVDGAGGKAH